MKEGKLSNYEEACTRTPTIRVRAQKVHPGSQATDINV